jgi:DNA polymerase-1
MSIKGMPWSIEKAAEYTAHHAKATSEAAEELLNIAPIFFVPQEVHVRKVDGSEPAALKEALNAYCIEAAGIALPRGEGGDHSTNAGEIALVPELAALPGVKAYMKLKTAKKLVSMSAELSELARRDGRLHPLISLSTVTLRTASQAPNVQNMPRDPAFRALVAAITGHKILSIDYGQIELRIAAALAARAWAEILVATPDSHPELNWKTLSWIEFESARKLGLSDEVLPERVQKPARDGGLEELQKFYFSEFAHLIRKVKTGGLVMAGVFQSGLDPHLLTAVAKASRTGKIDLAGATALTWMKEQPKDDLKALKDTLKHERQTAKPNNFGLLYGMSADGLWGLGISQYGLDWSKEDAAADRAAWLDLYPELALWQMWVQFSQSRKRKFMMMKYMSYKKSWTEEEGLKTWHVKTLADRPLCAVVARDGMNYQDQGSGADMIMTAIAQMPEPAASCMINIVHDELVFEVPEDQLEVVQAQAEATMLAAAEKLLAPYDIPVEAEGSAADVWVH